MTMKWLTILQFLEIVAAYGIVTLFLPWLVLRKRFRRQQSCDTDGRHRGAVSSGVDLEKKK